MTHKEAKTIINSYSKVSTYHHGLRKTIAFEDVLERYLILQFLEKDIRDGSAEYFFGLLHFGLAKSIIL